jgi:hypothetical protein
MVSLRRSIYPSISSMMTSFIFRFSRLAAALRRFFFSSGMRIVAVSIGASHK